MIENLKSLIDKLNLTCRRAAEQAASLCVSHNNFEVDIEHLFLSLLENAESDVYLICKYFNVNIEQLTENLNSHLLTLKTGNNRTPVFSHLLPKIFQQAWLLSSLENNASPIRSAYLLLALLTENELYQISMQMSPLFLRFPIDELKHKISEITASFPESASMPKNDKNNINEANFNANPNSKKTPALDKYTINLTEKAQQKKIDPVIGREQEIRQVINILLRRRQNNPILTGEAGVGKTAIVEGLAQKIIDQDVPDAIKNVSLHILDLSLLQAGASVKGEFESRLKSVIDEVKSSVKPVILFIDEAHTLIGAGGQMGQNDAANLLKPALARGELRTIAATTQAEYKKYFEKDAALSRRFEVVKVDEPSEETACAMLRGMLPLMEEHFNISIRESAVTEAVRLSKRYITGRKLPDKAVSVLDSACAMVSLSRNSTPENIDELIKQKQFIHKELFSLKRDIQLGENYLKKINELEARLTEIESQLEELTKRWEQEKILVNHINDLTKKIQALKADSNNSPNDSFNKLSQELKTAKQDLNLLQKDNVLIPVCADGQIIAEIVSKWTGIPLGNMIKNEIDTLLNLSEILEKRIIGQSHAISLIAQSIQTSKANLEDPNKPKGVFLLAGPSGVGKTETSLAIADVLYGGEHNIIKINMSEYQEAHSVSGLKGSPPGYVGYGEGGVLTEAVRRKPYSVILLDEIEKAHPDVLEIFFQVFDKGIMEDAEGQKIDFKNTIIILTSNVASAQIMQACLNKEDEEMPSMENLYELIMPSIYKAFKPAFVGRTKVIPYYPLSDDMLAKVIKLKLGRIKDRILTNHNAEFIYSDEVVEVILNRCNEVDTGARNIDNILNGSLLPIISLHVLTMMGQNKAIKFIALGVDENDEFTYDIQ